VSGDRGGEVIHRSGRAHDAKELFAVRGASEHLRRDNGPEFVAKEIQEWLARACVRTLYIQKASPRENGSVESYNGRLRDELLDRELFLSLLEARVVLDQWRMDDNHRWPHGGLKWLTPAAFDAGLDNTGVHHERWYRDWEGVSVGDPGAQSPSASGSRHGSRARLQPVGQEDGHPVGRGERRASASAGCATWQEDPVWL
jgi:hypothetical protein